jgi:hypothetical protein
LNSFETKTAKKANEQNPHFSFWTLFSAVFLFPLLILLTPLFLFLPLLPLIPLLTAAPIGESVSPDASLAAPTVAPTPPPAPPAGKKGVVSVKTSLRSIVLGDVLSQRTLQKYKGKKIPEHLHQVKDEDNEKLCKLKAVVLLANKLMRRAYFFVRLFLLSKYHDGTFYSSPVFCLKLLLTVVLFQAMCRRRLMSSFSMLCSQCCQRKTQEDPNVQTKICTKNWRVSTMTSFNPF